MTRIFIQCYFLEIFSLYSYCCVFIVSFDFITLKLFWGNAPYFIFPTVLLLAFENAVIYIHWWMSFFWDTHVSFSKVYARSVKGSSCHLFLSSWKLMSAPVAPCPALQSFIFFPNWRVWYYVLPRFYIVFLRSVGIFLVSVGTSQWGQYFFVFSFFFNNCGIGISPSCLSILVLYVLKSFY